MKNPKLYPNPQINDIFAKTCQMLDVSKSDALSKNRKRELVECRQIAMYFCAENTKFTYSQIGYDIGDKDHSTVLHAKKTVTNLLQTDKQFREKYARIEAELKKIIQVGNLCDIDLTKWGFEFIADNCFMIFLPNINSIENRRLRLVLDGLENNQTLFNVQYLDWFAAAVIRQVETLTELQEVYKGFTGNYLTYRD